MKKGTTGEVHQHIDAPPEVVYDLVADVTRMGEWSPECTRGEWLNGATGPAVGARFKGSNRRGLARWSTRPRVVAAERGREFGFIAPDPLGRDFTKWTYRFEVTTSGTEVFESFEMLRDVPLVAQLFERWLMGVTDRETDLEDNMRKTLVRLKEVADRVAHHDM